MLHNLSLLKSIMHLPILDNGAKTYLRFSSASKFYTSAFHWESNQKPAGSVRGNVAPGHPALWFRGEKEGYDVPAGILAQIFMS